MQASLEQDDIDKIADKVIEAIKPLLKCKEPDDDRFMMIGEAASLLGVEKSWLYNNHEREGMAVYKIGGLKFKKSDLMKWAKSKIKV